MSRAANRNIPWLKSCSGSPEDQAKLLTLVACKAIWCLSSISPALVPHATLVYAYILSIYIHLSSAKLQNLQESLFLLPTQALEPTPLSPDCLHLNLRIPAESLLLQETHTL